ncbi:MAG: hypothetical protein AAF203_01485, partial [Pseudomonadota bacterium]
MNSYNKLKKIILAFFVVWFSAALPVGSAFKYELNYFFPYFSWRLFERVFYTYHDYGVILIELDG